MAASPTTKKSLKKLAHKLAEKKVAEEIFTAYLTWWTRKEINELVATDQLLLIPLPDNAGYRLGIFEVRRQPNDDWHIYREQQFHAKFYNKQAAFFYCWYEVRKKFRQSRDLIQHDTLVGQLQGQYDFYRYKYQIACKNADNFKQFLYVSRLSEVGPRLKYATKQLDKLLKLAKYYKFQDTDHETTRTRKQGHSQAH